MDHFARFESLLASSGGVEAMQKDVTALQKKKTGSPSARLKAWSSTSNETGSLRLRSSPRAKQAKKNGDFHMEKKAEELV